ncbi:hypothetical protein ZIOFF_022677 [Zingiber officinale]|uniref:Uncharacterized protein n=1 Tax=Zingiber officinale TaxID=94328 RepID=A0A8J5H5J5_ZINOF|nr:hypothetical protein ZIOFF_022677 [Zingiber officinale]
MVFLFCTASIEKVLQSSPGTGQNGVELEVAGLNWISFLDQSRVLWSSPNQWAVEIGLLVWVLPGHPTSIEWGILKPVSRVVKVTVSSPSQWVDCSPSPKSLFYDHAQLALGNLGRFAFYSSSGRKSHGKENHTVKMSNRF